VFVAVPVFCISSGTADGMPFPFSFWPAQQSRRRGRRGGPETYMAIITMERPATKVAIEANAAMSRRRSVIVVSCVRYVYNLFYFCTQVNKRTNGEWSDVLYG
jgi:hypothetical protein